MLGGSPSGAASLFSESRFSRSIFRQDLTDQQRVLDAFVNHELKSWRVASFNATGDLALQEPGGVLQPAKRKLLLLFVPHDADGDLGLTHIGTDRHSHDSHVANARVSKFGKYRRSYDLADRFCGFQQTSTGHEREGTLMVYGERLDEPLRSSL